MSQDVTTHRKKYYKVTLDGVDERVSNLDSLAVKMSLSMRATLPRARNVLRRLPAVIKRDLDVNQANKLKNILEQLGGKVTISSYTVTIGADDARVPERRPAPEPEGGPEVTLRIVCAACGAEVEEGTAKCPACGEPVAMADRRGPSAAPAAGPSTVPTPEPSAAPAEAASAGSVAPEKPASRVDVVDALRRNKYLVAAFVLAVLLLLAILKQ